MSFPPSGRNVGILFWAASGRLVAVGVPVDVEQLELADNGLQEVAIAVGVVQQTIAVGIAQQVVAGIGELAALSSVVCQARNVDILLDLEVPFSYISCR
jgi:hypothetical protein